MNSGNSISEAPRTFPAFRYPKGLPEIPESTEQADFFAMRCLVIFVPYDLFMAVEFRIRESGGHISIMERRRKHADYKLSIAVPSSIAHTFTQYETKS